MVRTELSRVEKFDRFARTVRFGNKMSTVGDVGLLASGLAFGASLYLGFSPSADLQNDALIALCGTGLAAAVGVGATSIGLVAREVALVESFQFNNALANKYRHAELTRWIKRAELVSAVGVSLGFAPVPVVGEVLPALGILGYIGLRAWSYGAGRSVKKELKRLGY